MLRALFPGHGKIVLVVVAGRLNTRASLELEDRAPLIYQYIIKGSSPSKC